MTAHDDECLSDKALGTHAIQVKLTVNVTKTQSFMLRYASTQTRTAVKLKPEAFMFTD